MLRLTDLRFDERVSAQINLSNSQLQHDEPAQVALSTTYAAARFNAWLFARNNANGDDMMARKEEAIELFCREFRQMFIENFDDYAKNHETYLG
ncbi:MAG TPA: DUF3144 domain-containing protein [Asticcacaulis sp.]|nr:DUF3144 domain-containing protein [Asticcacaulis sp.]